MHQVPRPLRPQSGLNRLEIAVAATVLVLFVLGVLQGRQLLERLRVSDLEQDVSSIAAAVFAYQDRYGRIPGDDGPLSTLNARDSGWRQVGAGDADGVLEVTANQTFTGGGEGSAFWQQLKAAGFIAGDSAATGQSALPENPWGGLLGVTSANMGGNLEGNKLCASRIPGSAAVAIDSELDDGQGASGRLRASPAQPEDHTAPSNIALEFPYSDTGLYTLCYRM